MQASAQSKYYLSILLLIASISLLTGLNKTDLRGSTEPREAGVAAYMVLSGDYVVPRLNGKVFLEKPPLSYWLQAASIQAFGNQPISPRLPSALAGIGTVLLLYLLVGTSGQGPAWSRIIPGLVLLTEMSFWMTARTAGQDELLAFGIALALLSYYRASETGKQGFWLSYATGLAISIMTKGIVGLAIPAVVISAHLAYAQFHQRVPGLRKWVLPVAYGSLGLLPFLWWLFALYQAQDAAAVGEILISNSVGRFQGDYALGAHAEPFYYYFKILPLTFQPWLVVFVLALASTIRSRERSGLEIFLLIWIFASYALLSVSAGKRPSYLIMLYPAVALYVATYLSKQIQSAGLGGNKKHRLLFWAHLAAVAIILLYLLYFTKVKIPGYGGHILLLAFVAALVGLARMGRRRLAASAILTAALLLSCYYYYFSHYLPAAESQKTAAVITGKLSRALEEGRPVALYKPFERLEGAVSFYLQKRLPVIDDPSQLDTFLQSAPSALALSARNNIDPSHYKIIDSVDYDNRDFVYITSQ